MIGKGVAALVALGVAGAPPARAWQDSALASAFTQTRLALRLEAGRLAGPGGELLAREAAAARFTLVGEEHGVREVPALVQALLRALAPEYRVLALEVSPLAARRIAEVGASPDTRQAFDRHFRDEMNWMAFYTMPPETDLLAWAVARDGGRLAVWGLDYEIWADRYWLKWLEPMVRPSARPAVAAARALADSGFARARRGDPSAVFSFTAPESLFTALRAAVAPSPRSDAAAVLGVLERTVEINRPFLAGRNYESNLKRSANLKRHFLAYWDSAGRAGPPPRVLFKFGAYHMERGLNGVRQYDVGWLAAAVAEARGEASFHVLVVGGPDTQHAVFDIGTLDYVPRPVESIAAPALAPARAALLPLGFTLFDLRPLRAAIQDRRLRAVDPSLERTIFNFDALVVLGGSTASVP
jgi:hypothetical protein